MDGNFCNGTTEQAGASPPSEAWLFAQALLGRTAPNPAAAADVQAKRAQLEWLASISTKHERELRRLLSAKAEARANREQLEWLAAISTKHEQPFRRLLAAEAEASEAHERHRRLAETSCMREWDASKHPRGGFPENRGWFSTTGGSGASGRTPSLFDAIIQRNRDVHDLTGVLTPDMIRSSRIAADLESAVRLPDDVAKAAAAGLLTGTKAVVNGSVTAVKNVATLGLSTSQLELIGVTKEDRARGYDTAVAISTASGELLIAVGTSGLSSALSKGGSVARTASGALVAFDAAGNAVGVVQGTYDAAQNGVTIQNGAQIAAGALGLGANISAAKSLTTPRVPAQTRTPTPAGFAPSDSASVGPFSVGKHGEMPTPRPRPEFASWSYVCVDGEGVPGIRCQTSSSYPDAGRKSSRYLRSVSHMEVRNEAETRGQLRLEQDWRGRYASSL